MYRIDADGEQENCDVEAAGAIKMHMLCDFIITRLNRNDAIGMGSAARLGAR
jgi:hypothetical protein